jgi:hypothetical protein
MQYTVHAVRQQYSESTQIEGISIIKICHALSVNPSIIQANPQYQRTGSNQAHATYVIRIFYPAQYTDIDVAAVAH